LARAYQRSDNCNMARFWFEALLERVGDDPGALAEDRPRLAQEAIDDLSQQCTESARIAMGMADPDVEIVLQRVGEDGESAVFTYPFEGRIDAGEYVLIARRDGFEPSSQRVVIVANAANRIEVPPLIPTSLRGRLRVTCPASVSELQL